jgi:hypothetical protein
MFTATSTSPFWSAATRTASSRNHEVPEGSTAAILVLSVAGRSGPLALGTHDLSYQFDLSDPHPAVARQHGQQR